MGLFIYNPQHFASVLNFLNNVHLTSQCLHFKMNIENYIWIWKWIPWLRLTSGIAYHLWFLHLNNIVLRKYMMLFLPRIHSSPADTYNGGNHHPGVQAFPLPLTRPALISLAVNRGAWARGDFKVCIMNLFDSLIYNLLSECF
jgi:hypothetical protein